MDDIFYLQKAIELSRLAQGGKNFRVGAIIVKNNTIISTGYSWELGEGTHAEENAFSKLIKEEAEDAILYCSMAPCTQRLSGKECCLRRAHREGIRRIVYACVAPDENINNLVWDNTEIIQIKDLEMIAQEVNSHLNWNKNYGTV